MARRWLELGASGRLARDLAIIRARESRRQWHPTGRSVHGGINDDLVCAYSLADCRLIRSCTGMRHRQMFDLLPVRRVLQVVRRCRTGYTSDLIRRWRATVQLYDASQLRGKLILPIAVSGPVPAGRRFAPFPVLPFPEEVKLVCGGSQCPRAPLSQVYFPYLPPEAL